MLVHKKTMGVLTVCWDPDGEKMIKASLDKLPDLNPDEWFEIDQNSPLGFMIYSHYPYLIPVVENGELVDVVLDLPKSTKPDHLIKQQMKEDALSRGFNMRYKNLPETGLLDFVQEDLLKAMNQ